MKANKRKTRLVAFSSIVCLQADGPRQTRRAEQIYSLNALERLENLHISRAFPPVQEKNLLRRMDEINESGP